MKVHGSHRFLGTRETVFAAIVDPAVLMAVIPGCEDVERVAPDEYRGRITLRLPGAVGSYRTTVRLVDAVAPDHSGLEGQVEGAMGSITGRADFTLTAAGAATTMDYTGSGTIGGPLARLDSRFVERLAESLIDQGLRALDLRLASTPATEGPE